MRYLYDQEAAYSSQFSWTTRRVFKFVQPRLRAWDLKTARRVTHFLANSDHVRRRIETVYRRSAEVLHPPVAVDRFQPASQREDFYVTVSALVPYKRVDLLIDAFAELDRKLVVVGSGPELPRLRTRAGSNITFTGWLPDEEVADLLNRCRGFVFAGVEDFGIAMVEAQAAGAPVIAYAAGGALDSVVTTPWMRTGVLFQQQNTESIVDAVHEAERSEFCMDSFRASAARFRPEWFRKRLRGEVNRILAATGAHALV
jgi:glycosyltransferase involved in cell wall biosynthesis